jgi:2-dehydropantoate 2-reductase
MKKINNVAIIGAGAMGAAYGAMFTDAGDFSVSFIASGGRYRRLKQESLSVNGKPYAFSVVHPEEATDPADLLLVALKHHHLSDALAEIKSFVGDQTIILSVMNGLESEEIIGAACGFEKTVYAVAVGIDAIHEGGRFSFASPGRIVFGQGPRALGGRRIDRLREALTRAAIPNDVPPDMMRMMWWKFMVNVGVNQASAVLRAPYGVFQTSPDARALMVSLMQEVVAVAQKIGIDLRPDDVDEWNAVLSRLSPGGKTSMLQDIEGGRKTEVEIFADRVVSLGEKHRVPTPVNAAVGHIIKVIEIGQRDAFEE